MHELALVVFEADFPVRWPYIIWYIVNIDLTFTIFFMRKQENIHESSVEIKVEAL